MTKKQDSNNSVKKQGEGIEKKGELTPRDEVFRDEYLIDLNPYRAAKAAGYTDSTARVKSFSWVKDPKCKPELYRQIKEAMKDRSIRTNITADKVLERLWMIAVADPNELTQVRRINCRHCYGNDYKFQWKDEDEFEAALAEAIAYEKAEQLEDPNYQGVYPNDEGGYGFNPTTPPNCECPKCFGEGKVDMYLGDTRNMSPHAHALFAGVKMTKEGIEIKMQDQNAALVSVARHLGMFNDKITLKGETENPLEVLIRSLPGNTLRPDEDKK